MYFKVMLEINNNGNIMKSIFSMRLYIRVATFRYTITVFLYYFHDPMVFVNTWF